MGSRHRQSDYKIEIFNATFRESNLKTEENKFKVIFEVDTHGYIIGLDLHFLSSMGLFITRGPILWQDLYKEEI